MQKLIKKAFDFSLAAVGGIVSAPVVAVTMAVIHHYSPEDSPIFKQERIGYKGEPITIYKLRTMTNERDENGELLPDEVRLKKWGKIIRKLSIDELTQLYNILKGEMSFIGPRPLLPKEMLVMTEEEQKLRQSVLPGITGWEAVNENKSNSREEMAQFDLEYVKNWSLMFDLKILFNTVAILFTAGRADDEYRAPQLNPDEIKTDEVYSEVK